MRQFLKRTKTAAALLTILCYSACYKDNRESLYPGTGMACDTANVTWMASIKPITMQSCALSGCHDAATASGGYILDNYAGVKTIADNGRFLAVITSGTMPKNSARLDDCSINKITKWVSMGALQN